MDIVWNHSTEIRVCIAFTTLMQDGFVLGSCIYLLCARLHSTRPWTKCVSGITWTSAKPISTLQLFVLPESAHTYIYILYIYICKTAFWDFSVHSDGCCLACIHSEYTKLYMYSESRVQHCSCIVQQCDVSMWNVTSTACARCKVQSVENWMCRPIHEQTGIDRCKSYLKHTLTYTGYMSWTCASCTWLVHCMGRCGNINEESYI